MQSNDYPPQPDPAGTPEQPEFQFEEQPRPGRPASAGPAAQTGCPAQWQCPALRRRSFFRRHPVLTALGALILFAVLSSAASKAMSGALPGGSGFGVVRIEGAIMDATEIVDWTRTLEKNASVKGVLVYVDSPGGAVVPSMEIYAALRRLNEKKPVVVYMSSMAASGGYLVSLAGRHIVANPATITGSVGVKMEIKDFSALMQKIGIQEQSLASGPFKDAGSPFRPLTPADREYLMGVVNDMFDQFKELVQVRRGLTPEQLREVSDGRIFTGRQALRLRLVDSVGEEGDAWKALARMCGLSVSSPHLTGPEKPEWSTLKRWLSSCFGLGDVSAHGIPRALFSL